MTNYPCTCTMTSLKLDHVVKEQFVLVMSWIVCLFVLFCLWLLLLNLLGMGVYLVVCLLTDKAIWNSLLDHPLIINLFEGAHNQHKMVYVCV